MKFIVSVTCCLLVVASLTVIVDCKVDIYHISEKLDNKLESFRFPTLPPWFPTGIPTGFPTGLPSVFPTGLPTIFPTTSAPEKEDKKEEPEVIDDKDDEIEEILDPESDIDSEFDGKCPESGIKVIRHKSECGKYILCFGGVRIVRSCAPGLHWSSKLQSCTRPEISECKEEVSVHNGCPLENDPDNLVFLPDYKNCSKYYLCFDGKPFLFTCANGFHWNAEQELCMEMDQAMCTFDVQTFVCPIDNEISYLPHESSCRSFYRCDNGVYEVLECADGFLWSQELGICNFHHLVDCKQLRDNIL